MPLDLSRDIVLRWDNPEPAHVALFKQAGITAVLPSTTEASFSAAGISTLAPSEIQFLQQSELGTAKPGVNVALTNGLWPGIGKPAAVSGRGDETASASIEPWVDSNGYWIGYLRALYPAVLVLGYLPDKLLQNEPQGNGCGCLGAARTHRAGFASTSPAAPRPGVLRTFSALACG